MDTKTPPSAITGPLCKTNLCGGKGSLSLLPVVALAQKLGCDGIAGSNKQRDGCQVCAGENKCLIKDCNGDQQGTAKIDFCKQCTGGKTGKKFNEAQDCRGVCFGTFKMVRFESKFGSGERCIKLVFYKIYLV